jgi:hypothetical protein
MNWDGGSRRRRGRINCHEHMFLEVNEETSKTTERWLGWARLVGLVGPVQFGPFPFFAFFFPFLFYFLSF